MEPELSFEQLLDYARAMRDKHDYETTERGYWTGAIDGLQKRLSIEQPASVTP